MSAETLLSYTGSDSESTKWKLDPQISTSRKQAGRTTQEQTCAAFHKKDMINVNSYYFLHDFQINLEQYFKIL